MQSYIQYFPLLKEHFNGFIVTSTLLSLLIIFIVMLSQKLRDKFILPLLSFMWLLAGIVYYLKIIGGIHGTFCFTMILIECFLLIINLESFICDKKVTFSINYWEFIVNISTPNTTFAIIGAFTMLVLPGLLSNNSLPSFPVPHLLSAYTFSILTMLEVTLIKHD